MSESRARHGFGALPPAIRGFTVSYAAFAVAALLNNLSVIDGFQAQLSNVLGSEAPSWLGYFGFSIRFAVRLLLAWFVVARASKVALWIVVIIAVPWVLEMPNGFTALFVEGNFAWLPWLAIMVLQVVALGCLLSKQGRQWITSKGRTLESDRDAFS